VVGEEAVEDVGFGAGVEGVEGKGLHLLEVGAVRLGDGHLLLLTRVGPVEHRVAELVEPLGERHPVLALARRHCGEHGADIVARGDGHPRRQVGIGAGLGQGDGVQQTEVAGFGRAALG
jgi:hypothetical protein